MTIGKDMEYRIVLSPRADKEMRMLESAIRRRVQRVFLTLRTGPFVSTKKLFDDGRLAEFRIRVGNYRILYDVYSDDDAIYILRVGHRKDIYR